MTAERPVALAIVGPTASGKTALSLEVARLLDAEIISMDSRQVYRGMDIGTAKATAAERSAVPHHGLDLVDPSERFSAGRFARMARRAVEEIRSRGRTPLLVGGTGFFLRALTNPIFREPELDPLRRARLQEWLEAQGEERLLRWLVELDRPLAARLARAGGRQRLLRALEMPLLTGRPLSWWQTHGPLEAPPMPIRVHVLDVERERLRAAIDARVRRMMEAGLLDEVRALRDRGFGEGDPGMSATGYVELLPVLEGRATAEEAAERVARNTRAYARRQLTWLRHQLPPDARHHDGTRPAVEIAARIADDWRAVTSKPDNTH